MHAVEPPEFFRSLDDDDLLAAREGIEETLDWSTTHSQTTQAIFAAWRINLSQTNAEITRRLWE
jgi:hypothetical protein